MRLIYSLVAAITLFSSGCYSHEGDTKLINEEASLPSSFNFEAMGLNKVISSSINRKKSTMSTLYGNDQAFKHAFTAGDSSYPDGSVLALVTWKQQEDEHWFGANIPGELQSIELVKMNGNKATYRYFTGNQLTPVDATDSSMLNERARYILEEKPLLMP